LAQRVGGLWDIYLLLWINLGSCGADFFSPVWAWDFPIVVSRVKIVINNVKMQNSTLVYPISITNERYTLNLILFSYGTFLLSGPQVLARGCGTFVAVLAVAECVST
jgi:hypothetical protein